MTSGPAPARWGMSVGIAVAGAVVLAAVGLFTSRVDIAEVGLPLAIWAVIVLTRGFDGERAEVALVPVPAAAEDPVVRTEMRVSAGSEMVEIALVQADRQARRLMLSPSETAYAVSRVQHSGPIRAVQAEARGISMDGAVLGDTGDPVVSLRAVAPPKRMLDALPVPRRLTGLHGTHTGRRPGHGGDFRDIHPFAPGDELRRVDWRATARLASRPGELLVRRTDTLSEASVVIAMDTAEDLGAVVASWGSGDFERSGVTSLDLAREAARSIAAAAIAVGDRVALHVLVYGGRSLRSGSGARHLARLEAAIAATGQARADARFRRTPHVPHGSVIHVLSTFLEGAAVQTAMMWRAAGHRVVAVDVLPELDRTRLSMTQSVALRVVLAERENVFADLRGVGIDVVSWNRNADAELRAAARVAR